MRMSARILASFIVVAGIGLLDAPSAQAGVGETFDFKNGKWRLELSGFAAIRSGARSRTGDYGFSASIEYEVPLTKKITFGLKGYPLYVVDQDDSADDTVVGAAFGPEFRFYFKEKDYKGFFFEMGGALLAADGKFDGNTATVNFLLEAGLGYKLNNNWHLSTKMSHVSNGGLAQHNSGVNSFGLALGYTF